MLFRVSSRVETRANLSKMPLKQDHAVMASVCWCVVGAIVNRHQSTSVDFGRQQSTAVDISWRRLASVVLDRTGASIVLNSLKNTEIYACFYVALRRSFRTCSARSLRRSVGIASLRKRAKVMERRFTASTHERCCARVPRKCCSTRQKINKRLLWYTQCKNPLAVTLNWCANLVLVHSWIRNYSFTT